MPKEVIGFENTCFYKIICRDPEIKDVFVGYTTNIVQRKYLHKVLSSQNMDTIKKNKKLYEAIQEKGGWENWELVELNTCFCKNAIEAKKRQLYYSKLHDANLNTLGFLDKKMVIKGTKYYCECCESYFDNKNVYSLHMSSKKHQTKDQNFYKFTCSYCNKQYKARSSLWYHEKKCKEENHNAHLLPVAQEVHTQDLTTELIMGIVQQNKDFKDLIVEQNKQNVEQNQEFKEMIMEQNKQIIELSMKTMTLATANNSSQQHINSHNTINNRFNLNVFLNEKCKDALNISDFINSLQISMNDVEQVGACGFVEGISKIFVNGLKQLDVYKRPIHCSDMKRETMHVKENNVWEKEDEEKTKIIEAIKTIADKNIKTIPEWKQENPDCRDSASKKSDQYLQIVGQALGACDKTKDKENYHKIIKKVAKEVVIDKTK